MTKTCCVLHAHQSGPAAFCGQQLRGRGGCRLDRADGTPNPVPGRSPSSQLGAVLSRPQAPVVRTRGCVGPSPRRRLWRAGRVLVGRPRAGRPRAASLGRRLLTCQPARRRRSATVLKHRAVSPGESPVGAPEWPGRGGQHGHLGVGVWRWRCVLCCDFASPGSKPEKMRRVKKRKKKKRRKRFLTYKITFMPMF